VLTVFSSCKLNFPRQNAKNIISTAMSFPSPFLAALKPPGFSSPRNFRNSTRGSWENKRRQLCWLFGLMPRPRRPLVFSLCSWIPNDADVDAIATSAKCKKRWKAQSKWGRSARKKGGKRTTLYNYSEKFKIKIKY